ncbi:O-methyltransferase [Haloimpatiens sp. FM7330]|uniref:O-methyltransferase n=1 Tax=Haloimpatiens sp. FM7330 TaxID=3298610 RepID=UPI003639980A
MSNITYDYIEKYLKSLIVEEKDVLREMEVFAHENSVPIVQKETARFLELMINLKKPKKILELGAAIGYSSILMCLSSNMQSEIVTVERSEKMIELANENIKKYNLEKKIEIVQGECIEVLENLDEKFDMIFMDAGKGHYNHYLPHCLRLLEDDGVIIADNVLFKGMVATDELVKRRKITIVKRMRKYLEDINDSSKFVTTVIPMGDGIAVTMRRERND